MKTTINHDTYGVIECDESALTGRKKLSFGGKQLTPIAKHTYQLDDGKTATLQGSYMMGMKLLLDDQVIVLSPPPKWYEIVICVFMVTFIITWGNIPALVGIIPMVGGAIGGAIAALFAVLTFFLMRLVTKIWQKLLIAAGMFVGLCLICFVIGYVILVAVIAAGI